MSPSPSSIRSGRSLQNRKDRPWPSTEPSIVTKLYCVLKPDLLLFMIVSWVLFARLSLIQNQRSPATPRPWSFCSSSEWSSESKAFLKSTNTIPTTWFAIQCAPPLSLLSSLSIRAQRSGSYMPTDGSYWSRVCLRVNWFCCCHSGPMRFPGTLNSEIGW